MKTITIILIEILFIIFIGGLCIYANQKVIYDFEGVKISKNNFDIIAEEFSSNRFTLCNLEENRCVKMDLTKLEDG